ncbi:WcbI family polysaccharide biosynthesis putative acetyltransferase [Gilvimarinus algae]|uniref:WcbI family polysaccharide biosynthesis putative acetyltransferase n=1 Tax=Gilvimarinus algae TaxID=3058037 RepID=A0ABT8TJJ9_9GAMM|nr:WcbI family polysaccharide biosynthesis putative acetyltransferase [Gilvimarinus sp. SDUM040014]MDO3383263.1 WcbI family polysaccharide biosynthesis putative acetyltransferase [Gilvimarinus sp. SDUM040014]
MKNIIIYATCQGIPFRDLLLQSDEIKKKYSVFYYSNFSTPGSPQFTIDQETLRNCEIFLYHPSKEFSEEFLSDLLPQESIKLQIPYITFSAYWPDFGRIPDRPLGKSTEFPYGRIPYRSEILDRLADEISSKERLIDTYLHMKSEIGDRALRILDSDFEYLNRLDSRDGPFFVRKYIENNFQERQLFKIFNHPKNELYLLITNQLLRHLELPKLTTAAAEKIPGHAEQNLPIHPATADSLNLNFYKRDLKHLYLGQEYSFEDFIQEYISLL